MYIVHVCKKHCLPHPLRPTLRGLERDAGSLGGVIGRASQLADSVSCKVRLLDQAKVMCIVLECCHC